MIKFFFWIILIGGSVITVGQVVPVYYNNIKIENTFKGAAQKLVRQSEAEISKRMYQLLAIQSVDLEALPEEFFENLAIVKANGKLSIGSEYHVVVWVLGKPESIDPDDYDVADVEAMDELRLKARLDFDFSPFAETP